MAMVASRRYVIAMGEAARTALFDRLDELVGTHPDLAGRARFELPYVTRVTVGRAAAAQAE